MLNERCGRAAVVGFRDALLIGVERTMPWSYQIRDSKGTVISQSGGFPTYRAAMGAANAEVERLKRAGNFPATITAEQEPWMVGLKTD